MKAVGNRAVGFQNHDQSFFQILLGFRQGPPLCIHTGHFLDVAEVPFAAFHINSRKLCDHVGSLS